MAETSSEASPAKPRASRNGRAAFFIIKEKIRADVRARHTLRSIYETHQVQLRGLSYRQFARYVARYLAEERADTPRPSAPQPTAHISTGASEPKRVPLEPRRGFHVDPMGMRNKNLI